MNIKKAVYIIFFSLSLFACTKKEGRFNYTLVKSKLSLTDKQINKFDAITDSYMQKAHANFEENRNNREKALNNLEQIYIDQDNEIKNILDDTQFDLYLTEMKIEREGREKYNMRQIKNMLDLDSTQAVQFDITNEAFYTELINQHDNYHGQPDVYIKYYNELNMSREDMFKKIFSEKQFNRYKQLYNEYNIGKSEH